MPYDVSCFHRHGPYTKFPILLSENVGPITFRRLLDRFGTASAALAALPELARRGGRREAVRICSVAEAEAELEALANHGARLVVLGDVDYPPQLAAIEDAPATLAVIGDATLPSRPCIAVVGSRIAVVGSRIAVVGSRIAVVGSRIAVVGSRIAVVGSRIAVVGSRIAVVGSRIAVVGSRIAVVGSRIAVVGSRIAVVGSRIAVVGSRIAVVGSRIAVVGSRIAVVGSRIASLNGRRLAHDLAHDLGAAGFVVVSGLARGIDAEAHRGAIVSGTVAVLASGVDVCYPRENAELYASIAGRGALVSEAPPGMAPQARHFPRRNRLISGLARGVLVVEANLRSGSLITARLAAEHGREVFAVPGSPLDPRARGCNDLIRQGATLTETAADVLAVLGLPYAPASSATRTVAIEPPPAEDGMDADEACRAVAEMLSPAPVAVDEIIRTCQLSPALVSTILLEWELAGLLERHPGNRVSSIARLAEAN